MLHFVAVFAMASSSGLAPGVPAGPGLAPGGNSSSSSGLAPGVPAGPGLAPGRNAPGFHNKPYPPGRIHSTLPLLEALAKWPPPAPSAKSLPLNLRFFTRGALLAFGPPAWQLVLPAFLPPHPSQVPAPWRLLMIEQWYWQGYNDFWLQFNTILQLQGYAAACAWSNSLAAATAATCHRSHLDPFKFQ